MEEGDDLFRPRRELEYLVRVGVKRLGAVAIEGGVTGDRMDAVAERRQDDAVARGRHRRQPIPLVRRGIEDDRFGKRLMDGTPAKHFDPLLDVHR